MNTIAPPPTATPTPPTLTSSRRRTVRAVLVIAAVALIAAIVVTLGVTAWGVSTVRIASEEASLPADMRLLVIDTGEVAAAVRITTDRDAAGPRASMRLVDATGSADHSLVVTQGVDGTRLAIGGGSSQVMGWVHRGQLTVTLPPELARKLSVTVRQADGDLFAQADLDQLVARSTDGAIVLSGAARRIDVTTSDGDVTAREPISVTESFSAHTVDGDVDVEFRAAAARNVDVGSRDGDIRMALPDTGPYLVVTSADSTSIRVPQTTDPDRAVATVTLRAVDGDVVLDTVGRR